MTAKPKPANNTKPAFPAKTEILKAAKDTEELESFWRDAKGVMDADAETLAVLLDKLAHTRRIAAALVQCGFNFHQGQIERLEHDRRRLLMLLGQRLKRDGLIGQPAPDMITMEVEAWLRRRQMVEGFKAKW
ncbi:MAG: hypothetical protein AB7E49_10680 [Campylobacterales bacterium]